MTKFAVMVERCGECLYGKDKIVSNERRADIIRQINKDDSYFICHKATIAGVEACCRGDWDQRGGGQLGRIMGRMNYIQFVTEAELDTLPPARDRSEDECCGDCDSCTCDDDE